MEKSLGKMTKRVMIGKKVKKMVEKRMGKRKEVKSLPCPDMT
jgi:hypothetical protein